MGLGIMALKAPSPGPGPHCPCLLLSASDAAASLAFCAAPRGAGCVRATFSGRPQPLAALLVIIPVTGGVTMGLALAQLWSSANVKVEGGPYVMANS